MSRSEIIRELEKGRDLGMDKCPNCKSKRINEVPGCEDTQYINTYYCMNCEKEFDSFIQHHRNENRIVLY